MRIRTILAAVVLAGVATLPAAGAALAADRDCPDFSSQDAAQAAFDAAPGDPELLDADDDGIACEDQFGDTTIGGTADDDGDNGNDNGDDNGDGNGDDGDDGPAPVGSVATGGGGTAGGPAAAGPLAVAGASVLVAGAAAFTVHRRSGRERG